MSWRFSLRQLLVLIGCVAVACAALSQPTHGWHSLIVSLAAVTAIAMFVTALVARPQSRAFAVGWLLFAIGYLAAVLGPWTGQHLGPHLLTSKGLSRLELAWHKSPTAPVYNHILVDYDSDGVLDLVTSQQATGEPLGGSGAIRWNINTGAIVSPAVPPTSTHFTVFQSIGHWLTALALGCCGGYLALAMAGNAAARDAPA